MDKDIYKKFKYYATDAALDRIGEGLSLEGALDRYFMILASDRANAMMASERFLINYLRRYPDACGELIRILDADPDRERFDQTEHLTLWYIIALTGHAEAQQYVADAAAMDNRYSMLTRMRAVAYMHDFEHPEPFLAETLRELAETIPPDAADPDARDLRAMAVLALGGLGSDEKTNRELKPEIGRMLEDRLATARDPAEIRLTLSAVGNYGGADAIDAVAPYLADPDPGIRQSAYKALRRMDAPEAASLLTTAYTRETDPRVLASAAKTIAEMPPSHRTVAFARTRVFDSDNAKEQEHLVRLLGETLRQNPENETTLRSFLRIDPDPRVKMEVYRYIAPEPGS
jgi:HEAT repeat protein